MIKKYDQITLATDSIKGEKRKLNQDSTLFIETSTYFLLFLFDGVSSIETSINFIEDCKRYIKGNYSHYFRNDYIGLADLLFQTNQYVINDGAYGMSTCSAVYINKENLTAFCVNIGDSRIYEYTNQYLESVTEDDVLPGTTNVLTKSLGDFRLEINDFAQKQISFDVGLLLCSDGFYRVMEKQKLRLFTILQFKKAGDVVKALTNSLLGNNLDDSTYIIIRKNGISNGK